MIELLDKLKSINYKKMIFPIFILVITSIEFVYLCHLMKNVTPNISCENDYDIPVKETSEIVSSDIYVDIKGSVKKPGVYKLSNNSRVNDVIILAGGLLKDANTRFINLSKVLNDGDVIVIYSNSEIKEAKKKNTIIVETPCICEEVKNDACYNSIDNNVNGDESINNNNKININTATSEELQTLSGIGESKANSIIDYRNTNGLFEKIEDITNVSGISETIFIKIKKNITV